MMQFSNPVHRALAQSLLWFLLTLMVVWPAVVAQTNSFFVERSSIIFCLQLLVIWSNVFFLFPRLFLRGQRLAYFLTIMVVILVLAISFFPLSREIMITVSGAEEITVTPPVPLRFASFAFPLLFTAAISITIEFFELAQTRSRENELLAQEQVTTELKFLKNQINPHFLFNALNNIYSLSMLGSPKTPESIAQLSDILRYVIYDCQKDRVPLQKEIDYIHDYVHLFQLKKEGGLNIQLDMPENAGPLQVPPILFIPFIENALKHSHIERGADSWVRIELKILDQKLQLLVANSVPEEWLVKDETGGVGLKNVKRRLELLFPNKYYLDINQVQQVFTVQLSLDLT